MKEAFRKALIGNRRTTYTLSEARIAIGVSLIISGVVGVLLDKRKRRHPQTAEDYMDRVQEVINRRAGAA